MVDYNPNIPQGTDNLSTSQGQILNNFSQLNTIFDVDHVKYDDATSANRGFHRKVRLVNVASDPVLVSPQTQLYTKTTGGAEEFFFANASTTTQLTGPRSLNTKGYATLPGGLIIQWNRLASVTNGLPETFALAFPNQAYAVAVTIEIASTLVVVGINALTQAGFTFRVNSGSGVPVTYIALGR